MTKLARLRQAPMIDAAPADFSYHTARESRAFLILDRAPVRLRSILRYVLYTTAWLAPFFLHLYSSIVHNCSLHV